MQVTVIGFMFNVKISFCLNEVCLNFSFILYLSYTLTTYDNNNNNNNTYACCLSPK